MADNTTVRFVTACGLYNATECAGFGHEAAQDLVDRGLAEFVSMPNPTSLEPEITPPVSGSSDEVPYLGDLHWKKAAEEVQACTDVDVLDVWIEDESRPSVMKVLRKRKLDLSADQQLSSEWQEAIHTVHSSDDAEQIHRWAQVEHRDSVLTAMANRLDALGEE